ncbi:MAG: glycosyltransferase family 2 protein [Halanaeroarchaeum sp.]
MDLSVVVPTLNGREQLEGALDALSTHAPGAEVVVVNGPSADGSSGMVREHGAADLLLELSERNLNTARNAGIASATGEVLAFVSQDSQIEDGWLETIQSRIESGADVLTGPVHRRVTGGVTTEELESTAIGSRTVRYFDGGNVVFDRAVLDALDGFDQYLHTGGARDAAHRIAGAGFTVDWSPEMVVFREEADDVFHRVGTDDMATILGLKYRSLAYRLTKNYGVRVSSLWNALRHPIGEALDEAWNVLRGETEATEWLATGRSVTANIAMGGQDGLAARAADGPPRRNPHGVSAQPIRPVHSASL